MAQEVSSSRRRLSELPPAASCLTTSHKALHLAYPVSQLLILTGLTSHLPFLPALNRLLLPRLPFQQVPVKLRAVGGSRVSVLLELVERIRLFFCRCHCVCCGLVTYQIVRICFANLFSGLFMSSSKRKAWFFFQKQQWHWLLAALTSLTQLWFFIPDFTLLCIIHVVMRF